jgi:hypothetical protein
MTIKGDEHMTLCLREQDLDWRDIADEIVALDAQDAVYLAVQGSGALLWRLLANSTTRDGLIEALVETYDIDAKRASDDVDEFLATLSERGLLAR